MLETIVGFMNNLLWGKLLVYGLVGAGIFFTVRLGCIQITHFVHGVKVLAISRRPGKHGLSSFQVFCTSMAARVGAGNMAGVAVAIGAAGPGAVFWMWAIAMLGMATAMIESTLAQVYKVKDVDGQYRGGPSYYMEKGLGQRWMGILFSILLIICFGLVFNAVQANTISGAMTAVFDLNPIYVGLGIALLSGLVIMGGLKKVARVSEIIVPIMALAYIAIALVVVLMNVEQLPAVFMLVINSAFGWQEAAAGGVAYSVAQAMQAGIARGLFSNEAGMGSAANIAASASPNPNHPASQGFVQMMGVFVDTIVICTATAAIILLSGDGGGSGDGIARTINALTHHVGDWGGAFIAFAILLFCFTSIIANYSYAETNVMFLSGNKKGALPIFRIAVLGMVMFGAVAKIGIVWDLADVSMGLMALVNMIALLLLSGLAVRIINDYRQQVNKGEDPVFDTTKFPELEGQIEDGIWINKEVEVTK
ncbi:MULTISPECIES: alanine/glycine:cation symporter family protein [unclassified Shewanella]|uniref:alanine/glycine:cation symporter family protein n=1 Tax=unclassified Shewanella TaxID=196818 RepID=UPI0009712D8E|nr:MULTISPECIES: alanine/glycine:cation symporter family protein [unclassified Shewanella]MDO6617530.1 alanine/glycine:cation symporter family protein [Shewanella sp. 6_MG-2023]MDO6638738.1 alanine/glycine:cation symporter family protein [Shewanella sp. 5_MG-2023]MDO6679834.1 alanine/glycine:cation symporter family protein [Shewanella sp. 4_MG-2023]PMG31496.1 sodium:alanine symporter [Shewanella sp. 10N.286.52.C2]PMG43218.1 sodium:alanine symporter [Shewanella sp. 10N.286.52.B9]